MTPMFSRLKNHATLLRTTRLAPHSTSTPHRSYYQGDWPLSRTRDTQTAYAMRGSVVYAERITNAIISFWQQPAAATTLLHILKRCSKHERIEPRSRVIRRTAAVLDPQMVCRYVFALVQEGTLSRRRTLTVKRAAVRGADLAMGMPPRNVRLCDQSNIRAADASVMGLLNPARNCRLEVGDKPQNKPDERGAPNDLCCCQAANCRT